MERRSRTPCEQPWTSDAEKQVASAIAQDAVVAVADAAATAYLFAIRSGSGNSPAASSPADVLPRAPLTAWMRSTRAMERFRNEVLLNGVMETNFRAVIAIFEDRHPLWGFKENGTLVCRQLPVPRQVRGGQHARRYGRFHLRMTESSEPP